MGHMMAPFLMPDGYRRPPLVALLRESSLAAEAGRLAVRRGSDRRARRRTPYAARPAVRAAEPVLLVPGFLAGDWTLHEMSAALRAKGYRTYRSSIHANIGCALDAAALVESRLERIADRRGSRVQIVGHSLGGMIARGVAVRRPDLVSGIVTMGSPMRAPAAHHALLSGGVDVLRRLSRVGIPGLMSDDCVGGSCAELSFGETQEPLADGVAMTNIFSRRDGIVDWRACIDPDGTAVEVRASHIGMAVDPRVIDQVLAALHRQSAAGLSVEVDRGETA
ncbi:pimeloyl-ACP methyl ester carboxylesterase [Nocardioides thalensis]|uniref:Pimeloyl-ACP methyl ester carboxylesterase n=2 Tax=Nocardioides thalensis TaxID=1914755 RepID=A0A853C5F5_9ACTN|nr:pimeloyl-ACP methyl ester carboxylesterase [Nocardioides thalensis]